ncbi:MAG: (2Fe-2S) ferredoxin domain-containing protein [Planctomycetaceae bacterium]|nr:(2Fe-2S) ferredoxin domain-containing protein [Planctomycetaceae bacterium]
MALIDGDAHAATMPNFQHLIFVCTNQRDAAHPRGCCNPDGANEIRNRLQAEIKQRGLAPLARACTAGCLEQCELGPTLVIYPGDSRPPIWYGRVRPSDVTRIVEETLIGGRVLEDLHIPPDWLNTRGLGPPGDGANPQPAPRST